MGKPTGFLELKRQENKTQDPQQRILHFQDFHISLDENKRRQQASRCMNCGVPFCLSAIELQHTVTGCPLHNLIPEWNDEIYHNNDEMALSRLLKTNPFPEFTGRVCPALCEKACVCGLHDEPVTICNNELFISEQGYQKGYMKASLPISRTNKKVAVIGSGPSGLTVAYKLNQRGHHVTVYEKEDRPGGLLMYGIPQMKLEKKVIERRIQIMEEEGINFQTNVCVGKDVSKEELLAQYDAIVLCCGAQKPRQLNIHSDKLEGVYFAVDFLKQITKDILSQQVHLTTKDKHVVVVGGGDTGNDCIATCIRQGCRSVTQLEMQPCPPKVNKKAWPMWPHVLKTDYGQQECIALFQKDPRLFETTVKEYIEEDKKIKAIKIVKGIFENGQWKEKQNSEEIIPCDILLIAAGFVGVDENFKESFQLSTTSKNTVETKENSYQTHQEKIFVAGDMHRGQSLVVWAIAEGKNCAKEVDQYLMGYSYMNK